MRSYVGLGLGSRNLVNMYRWTLWAPTPHTNRGRVTVGTQGSAALFWGFLGATPLPMRTYEGRCVSVNFSLMQFMNMSCVVIWWIVGMGTYGAKHSRTLDGHIMVQCIIGNSGMQNINFVAWWCVGVLRIVLLIIKIRHASWCVMRYCTDRCLLVTPCLLEVLYHSIIGLRYCTDSRGLDVCFIAIQHRNAWRLTWPRCRDRRSIYRRKFQLADLLESGWRHIRRKMSPKRSLGSSHPNWRGRPKKIRPAVTSSYSSPFKGCFLYKPR